MSKFYVGQKVRDYIVRPGKEGAVESIDKHGSHPVNIVWDNGTADCYTLDGRMYRHYAPTLVDADDEWYIVHTPAVRFEKWERVLVRDSKEDKWSPRLYHGLSNREGFPYRTNGSAGPDWKYCRKWDENLVGKVTED